MIADSAALDAYPDLVAVLDCHDRSWQLSDGKWYCIDIRERVRTGSLPQECFPVVPLVPVQTGLTRVVLDRHGRLWQMGVGGDWYCMDVRARIGQIPEGDLPTTPLSPMTLHPVRILAAPQPPQETR